jgi:hypothetical protein
VSCIFCGNESASFDIPGIRGKACKECNKHLANLHNGGFAESKTYFEIVTSNSIKPEAKDYLKRELSQYGSDAQIHFHETKPESNAASKNTEMSKNTIETSAAEAKIPEDCSEIKNLLREQNAHLQTIKYILLFFAFVVGIGLILGIVNAVQTIQMAKAFSAFKW